MAKPKTFEELLENNLRQQENIGNPGSRPPSGEARGPKREFLKRKTQTVASKPAKKYNYYVENFNKKAEELP